VPAPVVPCFRSEVRRPRDWRMIRSWPLTVMAICASGESMKPSDCEGMDWEKTAKASVG
jgi:hypothetical protein